MKKIILLLSIISLFSLLPSNASASHIAGGEITYENIGGDTFLITLTLYRDCGGIPMPTYNRFVRVSSSCTTSNLVLVTLINPGGTEVSQICPAQISSSECNGGFLPGMQAYYYQATIVLGTHCVDYLFQFREVNRNPAQNITNSNSFSFHIEASLNSIAYPNNNSPVYTAPPIPYVCLGQTVNYNYGVVENDGDSLAYTLVNARWSNTNMSTVTDLVYNPGYSATSPIIGVTINSTTGELSFSPGAPVGNYTVVTLVTEYNGLGLAIATVQRDIQFVVINCSNQIPNIPTSGSNLVNLVGTASFTDSLEITANVGDQFCFDVTFMDINATDVLTVLSNATAALPGATMTTAGTNPVTATVCWTVPPGMNTNNTVTFQVSDSACPVSGVNSLAFQIIIPPPSNLIGALTVTGISCNGVCDATAVVVPSGGVGPYSYFWSPLGTACCQGLSSITGLCDGFYILVVTDLGDPDISTNNWDTIFQVQPVLPIAILAPTVVDDGCTSSCTGSVTSQAFGGTAPLTYSWSNGGLNASITGLCAGTYTLTVTDANNCTGTVTADVLEPTPPTLAIDSIDSVTCFGGNDGVIYASAMPTCGVSTITCATPTSVQIGTGTGVNGMQAYPAPYGNYYWGAKHQILFTASELTAAGVLPGVISSLAFDIATLGATINYVDFRLSLGCTSASDLTGAAWQTGLVEVFSPKTHSVTVGWNTHDFDVDYYWDGVSNLVVEVCFNNSSWVANANSQTRFTATTNQSVRFYRADNANVCGSNSLTATSANRPNVRFGNCASSYTYAWSPSPALGQITPTVTGLTAQTYILTVTANDGCVDTISVTVDEPALIVPTITLTTAISCAGVCDGAISIASIGGQGPYTYAWDNGLPATSTHSNLCAGTYNVTVTDAKMCTVTDQIVITEPTLITASTTINTVISCNGVCDGNVTVNGAGGSAPLTYAWPGGLTGATQGGLCAGSYDVTITDASSCFIVHTVILTEPAVLTVSLATVGVILCNGDNTVTINSAVLGGSVVYSYAWSSGQTTANLTNVGAGTYTLTVTDAHNCTATDQVIITEPTPLVGAVVQTAFILCNGDLTASVTASASGGTPNYSYLWSNGVATAINANIGAANYSVTITDANGCTDVQTINVTEPAAVLSNLTINSTISCNGVCDGSVSVAPSGGTGPYTVVWQAGMTTAGNTATSLCGATAYSVTITDANNCQVIEPILLTEPVVLSAIVNLDQAISCGGVCDGQITAVPAGGTSPYTYAWSNGSVGASLIGLCAGNYTVTVTDANLCTTTASLNVTEPAILVGAIAQAGSVLCNGDNTVTLTASAIGGTPNYSYAWSNGVSTAINASVGAGTYTVTVTDANNCTDVVNVIITEPTLLVVSSTINSQVSCNGVCDGDVTITASGGTTGYTYAWPGGLTGTNQNTLCAGSYTVTVTDANACTQTTTFVITEPAAIVMNSVVASHASCNGVCDGDATVSTTGGTAPVVITWPGGLTGGNQTALCGGTYVVTATDANGCSNTISVVINEPVTMTVTLAQTGTILCNGDATVSINSTVLGGTMAYSYAWSSGQTTANLTNIGAGNYTVTVTDANLCTATANIIVTEPALLNVTIAQTAFISCGGAPTAALLATGTGGTTAYSFVWSTGASAAAISSLSAGAYSVTITDANGCTDVESFTITQPTLMTPNQTLVSAITCNGVCDGSVTYLTTGGIAPYTISWPAGVTNANDTATGLCANTQYIITITDANSCTVNDTIMLTEPTAVTATINLDQGISCGGVCDAQITATSAGGTSPFTYMWSNGSAGATINNLCAGTFTVTVTDANGCTGTQSITITQPNPVLTTVTQTGTIACFGDSTVTLTSASSGGTSPYTYLWNTGDVTAIITNMGAGVYSLTTTDANNCTVVTPFTVTEPADIVLTANITSTISCGGVCDGAATIIAVGGTGGMTFSWPGGLSGSSQSGLCAGNYIVTVTDGNACSDTVTVSLIDPLGIVIITNVTSHTSCNGVCDGVAEITLTGGTAPITIAWPSGGTGTIETGLCAGTHTVTVTDANGCSNTATMVVNDAPILNFNLVQTGTISCNGVCDGVVSSTVTGGIAPYTVIWPGNDTTDIKTGLCAGSYTVTVVDANGCTTTQSITVVEPNVLAVSLSITSAISCNLACDGEITAVITGGTGPFTAVWSDASTALVNAGLCDGTYSVTITDANGCAANASLTIIEPLPITSNLDVRRALCGLCNGRIRALGTSGGDGGPYTYVWSGGIQLPPFPNTIIGLCPGTYSVTITDGSGCSTVMSANVSNFGGPNNSSIVTVDPTCNGGSDGTATVTAAGGSPPYTYLWSSGGTAATETGLSPGIYTVTVTDTNGCVIIKSDTLNDPAKISNVETIVEASCNGICDGSISLVSSAGLAPYTYAWSNAMTGALVTGLCAGTYMVTTTDANSCSIIDTFIVGDPTIITATVSITGTISCNGVCDGEMTATATGGTSPYSMTWSNGGIGNIAVGLCAGTHTVTVTDANGCSVTANLIITEPAAITSIATAVDANCGACDGTITMSGTAGGDGGPYTYAWSNGASSIGISNLCAGLYSVTITDGNGCNSVISTPISNVGGPTATTMTTVNASCNGVCDGSISTAPVGGTAPYTYAWSNGGSSSSETALCAGIYFVTVTDANGCVFIGTDTIIEPTLIINTEIIVDASCNAVCDGTITLTTTGGTSTYVYAWSNGSAGSSLTSLCAGSYTVTTTDGNGCTAINTYVVGEPTPLVLNIATTTPISCNGVCDGELTAGVTGGSNPYTYLWSNGMTTNSISGLCAGSYSVTITDANGCTANATMSLTEPNAITATITPTNATCGVADGQVVLTNVTGGDGGPYSYLWSTGGISTSITNLLPGSYSVTITDGVGCTVVLSTSVSNNGGPTGATFVSVNPTCNGLCDGTSTVTPIGGASPYSYAWSSGSGTNSETGLCDGIVTVTITDASGCILIVSDTLTEPSIIVNTEIITDASCNGVCNGAISLTTTGGTAAYTYAWSNGAVGASISNLCAGSYTVTTTDANGCTVINTFNITEPVGMSIGIASSNANCFNVCDGRAVATASGGTAPYIYVWSNGTISDTATSLCGGSSYDVTVTDANGCSITAPVTISGSPAIVIDSITITNATCGVANGGANAVASGGTGVLTYTWNGVVGNPLTNAAAGTHVLVVTDDNGCSISVNVPINNDLGPTIVVTGTDITCFGDNNGTATVMVTGTSSYTYLWNTGSTNSAITGLTGGAYFVQVTDVVTGCVSSDTITISEPTQITIDNVITQSPTCGSANGGAMAFASGGTGTLTYSWNGTIVNPLIGASAGSYTLIVTDVSGCTAQTVVPLSDSGQFVANATGTDVVCFGDLTGTASVSVNPVGSYTYQWTSSPSDITANVTGLAAGTYGVSVTDPNTGCTAADTVIISSPSELRINNVNKVSPGCGASNGSLEAFVSGGSPTYTYLWNGTTSGNPLTSISAGAYTLEVTDQAGCMATITVPLSDTGSMTVALISTDVPCDGSCVGTATATAAGGTGPFTYSWSNGDITQTATALCAGLVTVTVTDAGGGCLAIDTITVNQTPGLIMTMAFTNNTNCGGACDGTADATVTGSTGTVSYIWSNGETTVSITSLCAGTYVVTASDASGCNAIDSVTIVDGVPMTVTIDTVINTNCINTNDGEIQVTAFGGIAPYMYSWSGPGGFISTNQNIGFLLVGTYYLTVTDQNGCEVNDSATVGSNSNLTVYLADIFVCDGTDSVTFNPVITGGTGIPVYQWYNLGGAVIGNDSTLTVAVPNDTTYYVVGVVSNGCSVTDTGFVAPGQIPDVDAGIGETIVIGESVTLGGNPTTSWGGSTFSWTPDQNLSSNTVSNPVATPIETTLFTVAVTNIVGCTNTDTILITVIKKLKVISGFTPNGDGSNDYWVLDFLDKYPSAQVDIYNRWGELLFHSKAGYPEPWDGTYEGADIPVGTYYYVIDLKDGSFPDPLSGPVTIIR